MSKNIFIIEMLFADENKLQKKTFNKLYSTRTRLNLDKNIQT